MRRGVRVAKLALEPCQLFKNLKPTQYIGFKFCGKYIEHLVKAEGEYRRLRVNCSECIVAHILTKSHIISPPVYDGESIKIVVVYNRVVERLLKSGRARVVNVYRINAILLTRKQREMLRLVTAMGISNVAKDSGVSRVAVFRSFKSALRKISELMT